MAPSVPTSSPARRTCWYEAPPPQIDLPIPGWIQALVLAGLTTLAILFLDLPLAVWARDNPPQQWAHAAAPGGDVARELMWLEQFGQFVCTTSAILAVALLDKEGGRRRALSIAIGCIVTVLVTHLLKDLIGRSRPFVASPDGSWIWGGPAMGFTHKSPWGAFPSAHTTSACALAYGLSWYYPRARVLFTALALVTANLRVIHTAHYLSDVLAGFGIGILIMRAALLSRITGWLISWGPPWGQRWWLQSCYPSPPSSIPPAAKTPTQRSAPGAVAGTRSTNR